MTGNTSTRSRGGNKISPPVNPKMRITPTPENPRSYPPFDIRSICGFTNNQVIFYLTTGAILLKDQPQFQEAIEHCKKALQVTNWDGASDRGHRNDNIDIAEPPDSSDDSECPTPEPGCKGIKFSPFDITKLHYNSTVAQYENWLFDLKRAFSGDPAKFPTSSQKIILVSMTLND
jgi:hypothetical protein